MRKVNMEQYLVDDSNFELKSGKVEGAPKCPYGNNFEWIGFDKKDKEFVRFTKSVFKILITKKIANDG